VLLAGYSSRIVQAICVHTRLRSLFPLQMLCQLHNKGLSAYSQAAVLDLIKRGSPAVEGKVRRVRDQVQPAVRDALRAECRLMFRAPDETEQRRLSAQVPVELAPGHPAILNDVQFPDDFERIMLLGRHRAWLVWRARRLP
jgi:hypothetical protein